VLEKKFVMFLLSSIGRRASREHCSNYFFITRTSRVMGSALLAEKMSVIELWRQATDHQ